MTLEKRKKNTGIVTKVVLIYKRKKLTLQWVVDPEDRALNNDPCELNYA